jgi:hypothetical protein
VTILLVVGRKYLHSHTYVAHEADQFPLQRPLVSSRRVPKDVVKSKRVAGIRNRRRLSIYLPTCSKRSKSICWRSICADAGVGQVNDGAAEGVLPDPVGQ